jgi:hypothetical protein
MIQIYVIHQQPGYLLEVEPGLFIAMMMNTL